MGHESFRKAFINVLKAVLGAEEGNENANMALNFCATFVTSSDSDGTEPMLAETFHWLLTVSVYCTYCADELCS